MVKFGNFEASDCNLIFPIYKNFLILTRLATAGFKTTEEGRAKIM